MLSLPFIVGGLGHDSKMAALVQIGGNAALSSRGEQYAQALARYINSLERPCTQVSKLRFM
jgi:hypothetical protein